MAVLIRPIATIGHERFAGFRGASSVDADTIIAGAWGGPPRWRAGSFSGSAYRPGPCATQQALS